MILNHRTTGNRFSNIKIGIKGLPQKQREALDSIATGGDKMVHPEIGEALIRKGLAETYEEILSGGPQVTAMRYRVPSNVYAVWLRVRTEEIRTQTCRN